MLDPRFQEKCERIAVTYRRKLGGRMAFDPLPSGDVLYDLSITLISPSDLPFLTSEQRQQLLIAEDWSAAIVQRNPIIVLYNSNHSPARHESNMMHECSHIILNHPMQVLNPFSPNPPGDPTCEAEATYLGGCLQIPRRGLLWAIQKRMITQEIAAHFGASIEMVLYRANMTGQRHQMILYETLSTNAGKPCLYA